MKIFLFLILFSVPYNSSHANYDALELIKTCKMVRNSKQHRRKAGEYFSKAKDTYYTNQALPKFSIGYSTNEIVDNSSRYKISMRGRPLNLKKIKVERSIINLRKNGALLKADKSKEDIVKVYINLVLEYLYLSQLKHFYKPLAKDNTAKNIKALLKNLSFKQISKIENRIKFFGKMRALNDRISYIEEQFSECSSNILKVSEIDLPQLDFSSFGSLESLKEVKQGKLYKRCVNEIEQTKIESTKNDFLQNINILYSASRVFPTLADEKPFNELQVGLEFSIPFGEKRSLEGFTTCHGELNEEITKRARDRSFIISEGELYPIYTFQIKKYKAMLEETKKLVLNKTFEINKYLEVLEKYEEVYTKLLTLQKLAYSYNIEKISVGI